MFFWLICMAHRSLDIPTRFADYRNHHLEFPLHHPSRYHWYHFNRLGIGFGISRFGSFFKLIPIQNWLESNIKPLVGVGLLFLLGRDLLLEARVGKSLGIILSCRSHGALWCSGCWCFISVGIRHV